MRPQLGLFIALIAFVGTHFLLSHPLRGALVRKMGEKAFSGFYSLVAILTFGAAIYFYRAIGRETPLWIAGDWVWIVGALLMWLGAILFVGSLFGNPAFPGARGPRGGPTGVFAVTRHPMMWGFALWALVHLVTVATPKAVVFDTAILVLALGGALGQDYKKGRLMGDAWHEWSAQTAFVPFTRGFANPGMVALVGGTLLWLVATWLHPMPVGVWRFVG